MSHEKEDNHSSKSDDKDATSSHRQPFPSLPEELAANLPLVHQILLLGDDPQEFVGLTLSGRPRTLKTPSYQEFAASLDQDASSQQQQQQESALSSSPESVIAMTLKRAFRDDVCQRMNNNNNNEGSTIQPAQELVVELHQQLRALIPNRKDLHSVLKDDAVKDTTRTTELIPFLIQAAGALSLLESDERAESTRAWIAVARGYTETTTHEGDAAGTTNNNKFVVTSTLYLLYKAELCETDKQDYYFSHFWAPTLARIGPELEQGAFQAHFGSFDDSNSAPATKQWLQTIATASGDDNNDNDDAETRIHHRHNQISKSWVEDILFRTAESPKLVLPEIFYLDQQRYQTIRKTVRMAVAGSALALHACQTAGQSPTAVLNQPLEPSSPLDVRRAALVQAMAEQYPNKSQEDYQADIGQAVVALARHWTQEPLTKDAQESLQSRTEKVLAAQDPVVALLDERMKTCFAELLLEATTDFRSNIPTELRSGRGTSGQHTAKAASRKMLFLKKAARLFCDKGLAFYASDLALASWGALRIIELAIALYDENLLKPGMSSS